MRSFTSLFVFALSFVALVVSTPLQSNTHSSRFAKNPISSRQFRYPRALADVCANVDVSLILDGALKLGSSGNICLCLSALPLNLDSNTNLQLLANLIGAGNVQAKLEALVRHDPLPFVSLSNSHRVLSRSRTKVPSVLILIMLPPNAPLETSAPSRVQTALRNREIRVSVPFPIPSAMDDVALT